MKDIKTHEQTLTLEVADGYEAKTRVSIDGNLCVEIMPDATKKETDITILRLMADGYEDVGIAGPVKAGDRVITESWEVAKGDHCNMDIPACDWDVPPRAVYRKKKLIGKDWLMAQKVGTVFRLHKTLYVKGFYHVDSDNGEAFMFWASDFWGCSDETCEVLV